MSYLQETQDAGREIFPDLARAWALFGIAVVNVGVMSWPMMLGYGESGLATSADRAAFFVVNSLFLMKSYSLFSFMFGVGFAYQMKSADKKGVGFAGRYWRRISGLLAFGLLNVAFLFQGDILIMYAILGCLLFLFRKSSPRILSGWAIAVYTLQFAIALLLALAMWAGMTIEPEAFGKEIATMKEAGDAAANAFRSGTFSDTIAQRFTDWSQVITFGMLMQGIGAFAFFLFGLSAVKRGTIANPSAPFWKKARRIFLPIGLIISGCGAWLALQSGGAMGPKMMASLALITLGSPFSTAGYLGLIAKWAETPGGTVKTFFARGGTASLTAYLLQGLLLSFIFNAYGLGYFEKIGAGGAIAIGAGVALFTIAFASLWRVFYSRGPLEYLLRAWTYLGAR